MNIAIVGAGILGSIFGSLFSRKGFQVTLVEVLEERVRLIEREGLWLQWPDGERTHSLIAITSDAGKVGVVDLVMVAVKGYHTRAAIESALPMIGADTLVLSVQNGLGNLEVIAEAVGPNGGGPTHRSVIYRGAEQHDGRCLRRVQRDRARPEALRQPRQHHGSPRLLSLRG